MTLNDYTFGEQPSDGVDLDMDGHLLGLVYIANLASVQETQVRGHLSGHGESSCRRDKEPVVASDEKPLLSV